MLFSFFSVIYSLCFFVLFFFTDTATTEIYTLSLHDALPICRGCREHARSLAAAVFAAAESTRSRPLDRRAGQPAHRSEEHTSELQSHSDLVCRLLLEKKKKKKKTHAERINITSETVITRAYK